MKIEQKLNPEGAEERETTEHSPTRAQPGSQEAPPPVGGEVGISKHVGVVFFLLQIHNGTRRF